jgi:Domain of unknown function (DUF4150)
MGAGEFTGDGNADERRRGRRTKMGATVTNEDRGVTSTTSDHTYATSGATDVCWNPPVTVTVPHPNSVKTDKAVEHTSGKTLFQGGNVVRVQEALMPSDPAHGDIGAGGGVVSHTYRMEARATSGSPNVRVEGLPPARTNDPTTQNHSNTVGKIYQVVPPGLLDENPAEARKRCSYDESTIKCEHAAAVKFPQIEVKRGDTIVIDAKRKNAKEPGANPTCSQPEHMKWKVTRTGGIDWDGTPIPQKYEEFTGDKLTLKDWLPPYEQPSISKRDYDNAYQKRQEIENKNTYAAENAAARGSSRVEGQDTQQAYQQVKQDRERRNFEADVANKILDVQKLMLAFYAYQNPVRLAIVGNACSGSVTYEVLGYPEHKYEFELPLDGLSKTVQWLNRALAPCRTIGQLANVRVENSLKFPAGDVKIKLRFEWKEGEGPDAYAILLEGALTVSGKIFEWKFQVSVPLVNFLSILPVGGYWASRALGWIMQRIGADASIGFVVDISLSAEGTLALNWTKKRGFAWGATLNFPLDAQIYAYVRIQWRDNLLIEGKIIAKADPAIKLEGTSAGLVIKNNKFEMKVGWTGIIKVSVSFYTYEDKDEKWPDSLKCEVDERVLHKLI